MFILPLFTALEAITSVLHVPQSAIGIGSSSIPKSQSGGGGGGRFDGIGNTSLLPVNISACSLPLPVSLLPSAV